MSVDDLVKYDQSYSTVLVWASGTYDTETYKAIHKALAGKRSKHTLIKEQEQKWRETETLTQEVVDAALAELKRIGFIKSTSEDPPDSIKRLFVPMAMEANPPRMPSPNFMTR